MCLITWRWCPDQTDSLILLSNRDEWYDRPTAKAMQWPGTTIWAGQDLRAGGTWLGVCAAGRLAAVTNYRASEAIRDNAMSRGDLVAQFLASQLSSHAFIHGLLGATEAYNPFNLMVYDGTALVGLEGRGVSSRVVEIESGYGGVSNANFYTPWFKQSLLQTNFESLLGCESWNDEQLLDLLLNEQLAPIDQLPNTGLPLDTELALSATFVRMGHYGTRASSVVRLQTRDIVFTERGFDVQGQMHQVTHHIARLDQ